jgi:uncharacterized protein
MKVPSGVRVCILRVGIVLGRDGGVIAKMLPIFQLFAGAPQLPSAPLMVP